MNDGRSEIQWSPRVPKWQIRRLYELDAQGVIDKELLDDVGITLLLRCRDILTIHEARRGRVKCPRCAEQRKHAIIERVSQKGDVRNEVIVCPECGWQITWGEYALSFKRKQLNSGGALTAFERYISEYKAAQRPQQKMLAIDRLIHEFHYSLHAQPDLPCRPVGVNLIQGKLMDVIRFLDELTYGKHTTDGLRENRATWLEEMAKISWIDFTGKSQKTSNRSAVGYRIAVGMRAIKDCCKAGDSNGGQSPPLPAAAPAQAKLAQASSFKKPRRGAPGSFTSSGGQSGSKE